MNWYEGGFPILTGDRSYLPSIIQDARFDQSQITRREMLRVMRYFSQNSPLTKRVLDVSRQYVIGATHSHVTSLSNDKEWGKQAEIVFKEMCKEAGFNGESLLELMNIGHDCKKVDGDVLYTPTYRKGTVTIGRQKLTVNKPCLQMVEGHRIETPPSRWDEEGKTIFDGVQFSLTETKLPDGRTTKLQKRVAYWVRNGISAFNNEDAYQPIPVDSCYLVYSPNRVNQVRGISDFYAVVTTIHKLEDLLLMEMQAQDHQSKRAVAIETASGQFNSLDPKLEAVNRAMGKAPCDKVDEEFKARTKFAQWYEKISGAVTFALKMGEKVTNMSPTRPSEATLQLWEFLINSFCAGTKQPRILIFPKIAKGQGTEVRAELDSANTAYRAEFNHDWKPFVQFVWNYFMEWARYNDPRVVDAPADWQSIHIPAPRSVLVDAGYESAAMLAEYAAGVLSLDDIASNRGTTAEAIIQQTVETVGRLKQVCAEKSKSMGVDIQPYEVRQALAEVLANLSTAIAAAKAAEPDEVPMPPKKKSTVNA